MKTMITDIVLVLSFTASAMLGCKDEAPLPRCGDGVLDPGEVCDGSELDGHSCITRGFEGGTLVCMWNCASFNASGCLRHRCGNYVIESSEDCDGTALGGNTCESLGRGPGTLRCGSDCLWDISGCTVSEGVCGNGVIEGDEECDLFEYGDASCEDFGFQGGEIACTVNCTFNTHDCVTYGVMDVGGPCTADTDCNGGNCVRELLGPPGGYCTEPCNSYGMCPLSGIDGVCISGGFAQGFLAGDWSSSHHDYCLKECDLIAPDCRAGYICTDVGGVGICQPNCSSPSECGLTNICDTGLCQAPDEDCTNGIDDDLDNRVDCADLDCAQQCPNTESCANGVDDDADGLTDCDDADCVDLAICTGTSCEPPVGQDLSCGDFLVVESANATGSTNLVIGTDCVHDETPDYSDQFWFQTTPHHQHVYRFSVTQSRAVAISYSTTIRRVVVTRAAHGVCDPNHGCLAAKQWSPLSFNAHPGIDYYIVIDGWYQDCTYGISVSCALTGWEDCSNGIGDDSDGLVDCDDPECFGVGACSTESNCMDGWDNDVDGAVDCSDLDCEGQPCSGGTCSGGLCL